MTSPGSMPLTLPLKMELCSLPPGCSITSEQNRCKPSARLWRSDFQVGRLVFDAAGPTAVKLMLKTWVKQAGIRNVGGVLLRPGCGKRIACLVGSHLCIQPGLYAGLPGFAGAGGSLHPPPSGQGCRWAAEAADCANGVPKVPRWSPT